MPEPPPPALLAQIPSPLPAQGHERMVSVPSRERNFQNTLQVSEPARTHTRITAHAHASTPMRMHAQTCTHA
jgi:hypothetical protein